MNARSSPASFAVLRVAKQYRRRGYEVEVEPRASTLPAFLEGFEPDLIARNSDESVVVEVKVGTQMSVAERLREVVERVSRQPGWRFALVFAESKHADHVAESQPASLPSLEERAASADALAQQGQVEGAFVLLWSMLEGALRLSAERAGLPLASLPSSTLLRELYSAGEISREHFEVSMRLLPLRDQLVHGLGVEQRVETGELRALVHSLLADLKKA